MDSSNRAIDPELLARIVERVAAQDYATMDMLRALEQQVAFLKDMMVNHDDAAALRYRSQAIGLLEFIKTVQVAPVLEDDDRLVNSYLA